MRTFDTVTVYDADGVPSGGTTPGAEVSSEMPAVTTSDAATVASRTADELEADRRKQQSVYDRQIADLRKQNQDLAARLQQMETNGLDDAGKIAYERDQLKQRLEQIEAEKRIRDAADELSKRFGVDKDKLKMDSEEDLANSAWEAMAERVRTLEEKLALKAQADASKETKTAPANNTRLVTGSGAAPRAVRSEADFRRAVAEGMGKTAIDNETYAVWKERHPDQVNQWLQEISME